MANKKLKEEEQKANEKTKKQEKAELKEQKKQAKQNEKAQKKAMKRPLTKMDVAKKVIALFLVLFMLFSVSTTLLYYLFNM